MACRILHVLMAEKRVNFQQKMTLFAAMILHNFQSLFNPKITSDYDIFPDNAGWREGWRKA